MPRMERTRVLVKGPRAQHTKLEAWPRVELENGTAVFEKVAPRGETNGDVRFFERLLGDHLVRIEQEEVCDGRREDHAAEEVAAGEGDIPEDRDPSEEEAAEGGAGDEAPERRAGSVPEGDGDDGAETPVSEEDDDGE